MMGRDWEESCIMGYNHIGGGFGGWLDRINQLRKKMRIQIGSWLIENDNFRAMYECSYKINSFPLSNRQRDDRLRNQWINLPVFEEFLQVSAINVNSCKILEEEDIFKDRECLKKWTINECIPESTISWGQDWIILDISWLWWHNTTYKREECCFPYTRWPRNQMNLFWFYIEWESIKNMTLTIPMTQIRYLNQRRFFMYHRLVSFRSGIGSRRSFWNNRFRWCYYSIRYIYHFSEHWRWWDRWFHRNWWSYGRYR